MTMLAFTISEMMGLAGILLLTVILLKRSYRHVRRSRRTKRRGASKGTITLKQTTATSSLDAPGEVARWEVHLQEVSRDLFAQLDSKMIALSHLIRQAEQQCERLEAATKQQIDEVQESHTARTR